jgi:DNA-binding SARP family transcriptional activator
MDDCSRQNPAYRPATEKPRLGGAFLWADLNETFIRIALEAEATLGRREAVTERYEQLRRVLDDRLGLEPERATRMLYRRLLGQEPMS